MDHFQQCLERTDCAWYTIYAACAFGHLLIEGSGVNPYRRSAASFLFFFERFDPVPNRLRPFLSCSRAINIQYFSIIFTNTNVQANWLWFIGGPPHFFSRHTPPPFYREKYCRVFTDKNQDCLKANKNFLAEFLPYINSAGAGHAPRAGASTIFRYEAKVSKGSPKDTFGIRLGNKP